MKTFEFVGRDQETQRLIEAWTAVKQGKGPRVVNLVGDSGFGKTRIIREFYAELAKKEADSCQCTPYWPIELVSGTDINASFQEHLPEQDIPWLWWGIRCENPSNRNRVQDDGCALIRSIPFLMQHTGAAEVYRAKSEKVAQLKEMGMSQATNALGSVPGVGNLVSMFSMAKDFLEIGTSVVDIAKLSTQKPDAPEAQMVKEKKRLRDSCIGFFRSFMDPTDKTLPTIPVILILDDAQWADSTTIQCIYEVLHLANISNFPLLLVTTHWAQEWKIWDATKLPQNLSIAESWTHYRQIQAQLEEIGFGETFQTLFIERLDCRPIVGQYTGELGEEVKNHCLQVADGNPEMLWELLELIQINRGKPALRWWFENNDSAAPLSKRGADEFRKSTVNQEKLLESRLDQIYSDENLACLLQAGALQGAKFIRHFTEELGVALFSESQGVTSLDSADDPFHLVTLTTTINPIAQFRHQIYQAKLLRDMDPEKRPLLEEKISVLAASWIEQKRFEVTPQYEVFFKFVCEWFTERPEHPKAKSALFDALEKSAQLVRNANRVQEAAEFMRRRHGLAEELFGVGTEHYACSAMDTAEFLAFAAHYSEAISLLEAVREQITLGCELWRQCSRQLALTLLLKSDAEGAPKPGFQTAMNFISTSTPERNQAAEIYLELWSNACERVGADSLESLLSGLEYTIAKTAGANSNLVGDEAQLLLPCFALTLKNHSHNIEAMDFALETFARYLAVWSWPDLSKTRNVKNPTILKLYESVEEDILRLREKYREAQYVFSELVECRIKRKGEFHKEVIIARRDLLSSKGFSQSQSEYQDLIALSKQVLGEADPETWWCAAEYAFYLFDFREDGFESAKILREIANKSIPVFGRHHYCVKKVLSKLDEIIPQGASSLFAKNLIGN